MEWVFGILIVVMVGLYLWSVATARQKITPRIQAFVDNLLDSHPKKKIDDNSS